MLDIGRKGEDGLDGNVGDNTLDRGSDFDSSVNGPVFIKCQGRDPPATMI